MRGRLAMALLGLLALAACGEAPKSETAPVVRPVLTVSAHAEAETVIGPYVGVIQPRYQTPLSFQLPGRVLSREASVGEAVKAGQLLATLDATVQQFDLASAEASFANAQSQFANLAAAEERAKALVTSGSSAQAQLDAATTARQTAQAQRDQAQASLDRARDQLSYTQIVAATDGVVISVGAEVGQVVSAGQTIVTLARPDVREAVFDVPEALAAQIKLGDAMTVALAGGVIAPTQGIVREIAPLVLGSTRTQRLRLSLDSPDETLRIGAIVDITFVQPADAVFVLPASALLEKDGQTLVWLADPQSLTVKTQAVTLAGQDDDSISVKDGLVDGALVVTAGVHSLLEGQAVTLLSAENAS